MDASVALKWLLPEPGGVEAVQLMNGYVQGQVDLIAPELLVTEVGNVLRKSVLRDQMKSAQAEALFLDFLQNLPILCNARRNHEHALQLALRYGCSVYDCEYLALALAERCTLITADQRFYNAMHPHFPSVRLLGRIH